MSSFKIVTLGCKVNSYESQAVREILLNNNYIENDNPDIIVVNTCAVTSMAEHKSRQKVSSLSKKYPNAIIIVSGCSSQLHVNSYKDITNVKIIIGNNNHQEIISLLNKYKETGNQIINVDRSTRLRTFQNLSITSFDEKVRAFVKIGDGCNNFCSYCIIPYTRGNLRSRNKEEILCEIKSLIQNGYQEIVLTGIDSASYGIEFDNYKFNDLLKDILLIDGLKRLRISSIEASQIDDEFISILKSSSIIAPHLHIPLQSGCDTVLQRMRRKYTCDEFYSKIEKIKQQIPDIALACDVIVGFPGESEEEFNSTFNFIKKCGFAFLHVFPYSPREGTLASTMPNQISNNIKKDRVSKLIELGNTLSKEYQEKFIGKSVSVLIESYNPKTNLYHGLTEHYISCYVSSKEDIINKFVEIKYSL